MGDVKSKNMYELLGNDPEQDSDREPEPPTKAIDKPAARAGKRTGPEAAPARATHSERGGRGGRRGGSGNEAAYNSGAGNSANRRQGVPEDAREERPRRGGGERGRSGRGGRGGGGRDDRHSRGLPNDHTKQGDLSWGANTGDSELKDEQAGEAIAKEEAKDGFDSNPGPPVDADGNPLKENGEEAEEKQKSYAEYLAEQAEKKLALGSNLAARQANEGSKQDKKWASAKALSKEGREDESYISGSGPKAKREREQKVKAVLEIDHSWAEPRERSDRGGRGGRGRGEFRGEGRGRGGRGRGGDGPRGPPRGGNSGAPRGGRGGRQEINANDQSAFPSLGA